jgi:cell cycle related kinase
MLSDLSEVIRNVNQPLTNSQIKSYMRMLLNGVSFCHENRIMHRVKIVRKINQFILNLFY